MSSFRDSFFPAIVLVCMVMGIPGLATHAQTAISTSVSPGTPVSPGTTEDSTPIPRLDASGTSEASEPTGSPWIERIPAWQVVGTTLLAAFVVLLVGVIWLRWIRPGGR